MCIVSKETNQDREDGGVLLANDQEEEHAKTRFCPALKKKQQDVNSIASVGETLSFIWEDRQVQGIFWVGVLGGFLNGLVQPFLAHQYAQTFSGVAGASSNGLDHVRTLIFRYILVGVWGLLMGTLQTTCLEVSAYHATQSLRLQWLAALLQQDASYFDVHPVAGLANQICSATDSYRRGVGRMLGEGVQSLTTAVLGLAYAFWADWRIALTVLAIFPIMPAALSVNMSLHQSKNARAADAYRRAAGVAYQSIRSIRTVLSLNACPELLRMYCQATEVAFQRSIAILVKLGFFTGSVTASAVVLYIVMVLYGTALITDEVAATGCDPSQSVADNATCNVSAVDVIGALLGVFFAGQGFSRVSHCSCSFSAARAAVGMALKTIRRQPGSSEQVVYATEDDVDFEDDEKSKAIKDEPTRRYLSRGMSTASTSTNPSSRSQALDEDTCSSDSSVKGSHKKRRIKAILPRYEINAWSSGGFQPDKINGAISFRGVQFAYPTRPDRSVLCDLSIDIMPGQVVALVGPSGSGKTSTGALLERFYDPLSGSIELDGIDLKGFNVSYLRRLIGYVGQEPAMFACSIKKNILYGNPAATQEQIEAAAKLANAHDFIMSLPDGYDTHVGDMGSQLSGGQKQRLALTRALVGDRKVLLLDEATSALDSESELVVQRALDNIVSQKKITTVIIAHRLSTIRNADKIYVLVDGRVREKGTHAELMSKPSYYRKLVEEQEQQQQEQEQEQEQEQQHTNRTSTLDCTGEDHSPNKEDLPMHRSAAMELSVQHLPTLSALPCTTIATTRTTTTTTTPCLEFKNVSFAYPKRPRKPIFCDFNLTIPRSMSLAICGPSGGGKSTCIALMERFYDPMSGSVEYMGNDIRSLNVAWYRDEIGYVGQEPTLFDDTIGNNIRYGKLNATQEQVEQAARQANAHDFIMQFPQGYDTPVGEQGTQISGGQKQRISLARALIKKPKVLLLDEATSALDIESESVVQIAIDKLMRSRQHTIVVIAHRLSTIRKSDVIAFVDNGTVLEYGTHDELMSSPSGRYRRLVESSRRDTLVGTNESPELQISSPLIKAEDDNEDDEVKEKGMDQDTKSIQSIKGSENFDTKRVKSMAKPDLAYILIGSVGALLAGSVFPFWGVLFGQTIYQLFRRVESCTEDGDVPDASFVTCQDYWDFVAYDMTKKSYLVSVGWTLLIVVCLIGYILTYRGFGVASERLNRRVRNLCFEALLRQEISFFDKRDVGTITSQLQDDAARIQAFTGQPLRSFIIACSSMAIGAILSFTFMWPFALLSIPSIPLFCVATAIGRNKKLDVDDSQDGKQRNNSPGGIMIETLTNIRTVNSLAIEKTRFDEYEDALKDAEPEYRKTAMMNGISTGASMFIQQWVFALQFWWGSYLLVNYPETFSYLDFLIAQLSLLLAMFGLAEAFRDVSDRQEAEESAVRIFSLLDRESAIDPLSLEGKKLD